MCLLDTSNGVSYCLLADGDNDFYERFYLWFEDAIRDAFFLGLEPFSSDCNEFVEEVLGDYVTEEVDGGFPGGCWGIKKAYGTGCRQDYAEELQAQYRWLAKQLRIGQVNETTGESLIYVRTPSGYRCGDEIEACRTQEGLSIDEIEQNLEEACESFRRFEEIGITVCWASEVPDVFLHSQPVPPLGLRNAQGQVLVAVLRDLETNEYADWLASLLSQTQAICGETIVRTYERSALTYLGMELERFNDDVTLVWSKSQKKPTKASVKQLAVHLRKIWDEESDEWI